jgi:hypothetical protein
MHLYQGKALAELGRPDEGLKAAEAGEKKARQQGSLRSLWQILAYQAKLCERLGDTARAANLRQEARQIVEFIAGQIILPGELLSAADTGLAGGDERLRGSFLNLPEVRELFEGGG